MALQQSHSATRTSNSGSGNCCYLIGHRCNCSGDSKLRMYKLLKHRLEVRYGAGSVHFQFLDKKHNHWYRSFSGRTVTRGQKPFLQSSTTASYQPGTDTTTVHVRIILSLLVLYYRMSVGVRMCALGLQ